MSMYQCKFPKIFLLPNDSFISELGQHLQYVNTDLLRIMIQTGADNADAVRQQYPAMQLVGLVMLVLLTPYSISVS